MIFFILIPCLLIFLYCLYKFTKDDFVFIRRNISLEQLFDVIFLSLVLGLFGARLFFFLLHTIKANNLFLAFFSPRISGFSFTGAVISGLGVLYFLSKRKKIPLGRFLDFFTLALLITLPIGFAAYSLFFRSDTMLLLLIASLSYFLLDIFSLRFFYPKLLSRTFKEGNLAIIFLLYFSLVSLFVDFLQFSKHQLPLVTPENIVLLCLLFFSLFLFLKQEKGKLRVKKK